MFRKKHIFYVVIVIFFVFFINSCFFVKTVQESQNDIFVSKDSVILTDNDLDFEVNPKVNEPIGDGSTGSESHESENTKPEVKDNDIEIKPPKKITGQGKIAYSFPDTMKCYIPERGVLRITRTENDTILIERTNLKYDEFIIIKKIRVSNVMSSELIDVSGEDNFIIKELSSKVQNIEDNGYTQWEWLITPKKYGNKTLKLTVKVLQNENGESFTKDIPVLEKEIHIISNPKMSVINFINNNWQWLIVVILLPLIKYLYGFFKKKEKSNIV